MKTIAIMLLAFVLTACATVQDIINEKRNAIFLIVAEKTDPATKTQGGGIGTGFLIGDNKILTNAHVVVGATKLAVRLENGILYEAEVLKLDEQIDLALVKIKNWKKFASENTFSVLTLGNSFDIQTMDEVYALGNPWGLTFSVSKGIISHPMRKHDSIPKFLIQTDADVYEGNSGGPLLNERGEVIGMNSLMLAREGGSYGFALHVDIIKKVLADWKENGVAKWATLGIMMSDDNIVQEVTKDSPADKAGMKKNDKIVGIETNSVSYKTDGSLETIFVLAITSSTDTIHLIINRDNQIEKIEVKPVYKLSTEFK